MKIISKIDNGSVFLCRRASTVQNCKSQQLFPDALLSATVVAHQCHNAAFKICRFKREDKQLRNLRYCIRTLHITLLYRGIVSQYVWQLKSVALIQRNPAGRSGTSQIQHRQWVWTAFAVRLFLQSSDFRPGELAVNRTLTLSMYILERGWLTCLGKINWVTPLVSHQTRMNLNATISSNASLCQHLDIWHGWSLNSVALNVNWCTLLYGLHSDPVYPISTVSFN